MKKLIYWFIVLLIPLQSRADEEYYPEVSRLLDADLVIDATYRSSNPSFFWVYVGEVIKGSEYGLKNGAVLKVDNIHSGGCGFPFEISEYKRMRLYLNLTDQRWKLVFNASSSIIPVWNDSTYFSLRDKMFRTHADKVHGWLKSLPQCYERLKDRHAYKASCDEKELKFIRRENPIVDQLELQNRTEEEPTEEELAARLQSLAQADKIPLTYCNFMEKEAEFPGGNKNFMAFLDSMLVYPLLMKEAGIEGTVYVRGIMDEKGNFKIDSLLRGVAEPLDKEALRVLDAMPSWSPALQHGRPTRCIMHLPVKFRLH